MLRLLARTNHITLGRLNLVWIPWLIVNLSHLHNPPTPKASSVLDQPLFRQMFLSQFFLCELLKNENLMCLSLSSVSLTLLQSWNVHF